MFLHDELIETLKKKGANQALMHQWQALVSYLGDLGSVVVAYSGGIDSAFLSFAAIAALGKENVLAITIQSNLESSEQIAQACHFADEIGLKHIVLSFDALQDPDIALNSPQRCYHCKLRIMKALHGKAAENGFHKVIEGQNADDVAEHRPGRLAISETRTLSPLETIGLSKNEIRQLARFFGLSIWSLPSTPCLATRFPYGIKLEKEELLKVSQAEAILHDAGFRNVRVRVHGSLARIEIPVNQFSTLVSQKGIIVTKIKELGYQYVSLDLEGFREAVNKQRIEK